MVGATIYYTTNGVTPTASSTVYRSPITVATSETVKAIAAATGYSNSAVASATYTINTTVAATPTFTPAAGTYASTQTVTISDTTAGATIHYTTNGASPTASSTVYSRPITVSASETIRAIATASGYSNSAVASATYTISTIAAATPIIAPAGGTYTSAQSVTISDATTGATIYYTINGTTPTTSSAVYRGPINVSSSQTIKAIAAAAGYSNSSIASATYTIGASATSAPRYTPGSGTYTSAQSVTISDATPGATIYYTTNSTRPTTSSAVYKGPINVSSSQTIEAIAVASGYSASNVSIARYRLLIPAVLISPAPNSMLSGSSVTFTWTAATGAAGYILWLGSEGAGSSNLYISPEESGNSVTVTGLPSNGEIIYARLFTLFQRTSVHTDSAYTSSTTRIVPTVVVRPSASSITTAQDLSVSISVTGTPAPTGSITLTSGRFASAPAPLVHGTAIINIPRGTLAVGSTTLSAEFTPDTNSSATYSPATGSFSPLIVIKGTAVVTVTPSSSTLAVAQTLTVTVSVQGEAGNPMPTGSIRLASGSYTSSVATLNNATGTVVIPPGSLSIGTNDLTVRYSGNNTYSPSNGTASVTVTSAATQGFSVDGTSLTIQRGAFTANNSTITITPIGGFADSVSLAVVIASGPTGARTPSFSFGATNPVAVTGNAAGNAILTIDTTAPVNRAMGLSKRPQIPWYIPTTGTLACAMFFGIRTRRRDLRMLWVPILAVCSIAGVTGCSSVTYGGINEAGTTAGTYILTVTGTSGTTIASGQINLVIQ